VDDLLHFHWGGDHFEPKRPCLQWSPRFPQVRFASYARASRLEFACELRDDIPAFSSGRALEGHGQYAGTSSMAFVIA
jgi:hypothetical protein